MFTPINVIHDDADDEEVDDTRELQVRSPCGWCLKMHIDLQVCALQIEEALKLYQNAIRLQAQGPAYFKETAEAYQTLFKSEIFRYNDSPTASLEMMTTQEMEATDDDNDVLGDGLIPAMAGSQNMSDVSPSTLSQILHLAHKNRGRLEMDRLQHWLATSSEIEDDPQARKLRIEETLEQALLHFADALRQDESDGELWRRTARIATALGKTRVAQFCLESALTQTREFALGTTPGLGISLEEALAREQLDEVLEITIPLLECGLSVTSFWAV